PCGLRRAKRKARMHDPVMTERIEVAGHMGKSGVDRRAVLRHATSWALATGVLSVAAHIGRASAQDTGKPAEDAPPFVADTVNRIAADLAKRPFAKPEIELPEQFAGLTYDQYRDIRFRPA